MQLETELKKPKNATPVTSEAIYVETITTKTSKGADDDYIIDNSIATMKMITALMKTSTRQSQIMATNHDDRDRDNGMTFITTLK